MWRDRATSSKTPAPTPVTLPTARKGYVASYRHFTFLKILLRDNPKLQILLSSSRTVLIYSKLIFRGKFFPNRNTPLRLTSLNGEELVTATVVSSTTLVEPHTCHHPLPLLCTPYGSRLCNFTSIHVFVPSFSKLGFKNMSSHPPKMFRQRRGITLVLQESLASSLCYLNT